MRSRPDRDLAIKGAAEPEPLLDVLGLTVTLDASIRSTLCGAFWFTISLGYGEAHAYRSCYY